MPGTKAGQGITDLMTAYKAFCMDGPLAGMRRNLGLTAEKEAVAAGWAGYDATMRMASTTIDNIYRTPFFGALTARTFDGLLRWQQVGNAMTRTTLAGLVQMAGLPTQTDTKALRAEVSALRAEVTALRAGQQTVRIAKPDTPIVKPLERVQPQYANGNGAARRAS